MEVSIRRERFRFWSISFAVWDNFFVGPFSSRKKKEMFLLIFEHLLRKEIGKRLCTLVSKEVAEDDVPKDELVSPVDACMEVVSGEFP